MVKLEEQIKCTFKTYIESFYDVAPREGSHRYKSWEYCYKFFQDNYKKIEKSNEKVIDLASLHLSFYLASWGMYRGSSFLLQTDYSVHKEAVKIIVPHFNLCKINIKKWEEKNTEELFKLKDKLNDYYKEIRDKVKNQNDIQENDTIDISDTLITKILLGTLGVTPAYDRYFREGLKLYNKIFPNNKISATFNEKGFNALINFCQNYKSELKNIKLSLTIDEKIQYPLMKKVDMYFWNLGRPWAIKDKEGWKVGDKPVEENNQYINYLDKENISNCFEEHKLKEV